MKGHGSLLHWRERERNGEGMLLLALGCLRRLATKSKSSVSSKWHGVCQGCTDLGGGSCSWGRTELAVDSSVFVHDGGNKSG